jgi:hypothetical protein
VDRERAKPGATSRQFASKASSWIAAPAICSEDPRQSVWPGDLLARGVIWDPQQLVRLSKEQCQPGCRIDAGIACDDADCDDLRWQRAVPFARRLSRDPHGGFRESRLAVVSAHGCPWTSPHSSSIATAPVANPSVRHRVGSVTLRLIFALVVGTVVLGHVLYVLRSLGSEPSLSFRRPNELCFLLVGLVCPFGLAKPEIAVVNKDASQCATAFIVRVAVLLDVVHLQSAAVHLSVRAFRRTSSRRASQWGS